MNLNELRLTDRFRGFIASEVASGRYADESEVVNAALRLLEKQSRDDEAKLARLHALADEAIAEIEAGRCDVVDSGDELGEYLARIGRRVSEQLRREESV
ncbi:MAG TPA: type II toxin-antitoxin system ParD family antitoxin [Pirellulaceae bacterium]|jgi:putative addiction module CopG family antidote|nr:type II toxin-antitoxin system ParD family antitoxin [Pirellulaceae bacterium]